MAEENQQIEISLGKILKEKRQNLKMEISEISSYLRIKPNDIQAIENDDIGSISKGLYVQGMIIAYAKFLKIDQKITEEKIKFLPIKSNVENKKHLLLHIGENTEITPSKDSFFNFLLISILLFLVLLSIFNSRENKSGLITNQNLILELGGSDF